MQVKKFEAPTIQEALEVIKRELGPEAIILQTKKLKKGFGLMNKESVEVTAAVSERSIQKKSFAEHRLRPGDKEQVSRLAANRQGDIYDKFYDKKAGGAAAKADAGKRLTATRYADIDDAPVNANAAAASRRAAQAVGAQARATAQAAQRQAQQSTGQPQLTQSQMLARARAMMAGALNDSVEEGAQPAHQAETLERVAQGRMPAGAVQGNLGAGMSVEEELRHLKRMIEEMKSAQEGMGATASSHGATAGALATPALQDAFEQLVLGGMDKRYAYALVKRAAFDLGDDRARNPEEIADQLASGVMESTEIAAALPATQDASVRQVPGPSVVALVGPTGVGKTTTVAKMASEALLKRNLKVGLINLDSYKVAAFDQLSTYAKILNVPFRSVGNEAELQAALQDFKGLDLVLVDTTGRSQRDPAALSEMQKLIKSVPGIRTQLVLAVATRDTELYDQASRFGIFRPEGIVFSKLDEATLYGSIYNVAQKTQLPLLYFTTGQRVPEDLEEATRERVAALILDL
jgi:flagellar biosynthesis protein FlhF